MNFKTAQTSVFATDYYNYCYICYCLFAYDFFRTYMPSEMSRVVTLWKEAAGEKIGQSLADPAQYDNLFPGFKDALKTQQFLEKQTKPIPAASAASIAVSRGFIYFSNFDAYVTNFGK